MHSDAKQLIASQLFTMLEHKKIEDITVKSLVDACQISRQTFYYHFQDIIAVLEWGTRKAVDQALKDAMMTQDPREAVSIFVLRILDNKEISKKLLQSQRRFELEQILIDAFHIYLQELFRQKWPNPSLSVSDINELLDFYTYGLVGLILMHCTQKTSDPELLSDQLYRILSGKMQKDLFCE